MISHIVRPPVVIVYSLYFSTQQMLDCSFNDKFSQMFARVIMGPAVGLLNTKYIMILGILNKFLFSKFVNIVIINFSIGSLYVPGSYF